MNSRAILIHSLIHDLKVPLAVIELVVHSLLTKKTNRDQFNNEQVDILKTVRSKNAQAKTLTDRLLGPARVAPATHCPPNGVYHGPSLDKPAEAFDQKSQWSDDVIHVLDDIRRALCEVKARILSFYIRNDSAPPLESDQRRPMDRALRNSRAALKLIESATAILTSGRFELNRQDAALSKVLIRSLIDVFDLKSEPISERLQKANTLDDVKSICMQHSVILHVDDRLWEKRCRLDCERVNQVIVNLLLNAFKFRNNRIDISADYHAGNLILSIKDDGMGLPTEGCPENTGKRTTQESTDKIPVRGHGIGLLAVQAILQELGGELTVASANGQGSAFTVSIP